MQLILQIVYTNRKLLHILLIRYAHFGKVSIPDQQQQVEVNSMHNHRNTLMNAMRSPLTLEQIGAYAPAVLQSEDYEKVSDNYRHVQTSDIIHSLADKGWLPTQVSQQRIRLPERQGFQKHELRFLNPSIDQFGDSFPEIVITNSHDGKSAYIVSAGLYRLVCSNGLMVSDTLVPSIRVRHTGTVLDNVATAATLITCAIPVISLSVERMRTKKLSEAERVEFARHGLRIRYPEESVDNPAPIQAAQLLRARRYADSANDLWTTYNVVQENLIRAGLLGSRFSNGRRLSMRAVQSIDTSRKINQDLWDTAERFAA